MTFEKIYCCWYDNVWNTIGDPRSQILSSYIIWISYLLVLIALIFAPSTVFHPYFKTHPSNILQQTPDKPRINILIKDVPKGVPWSLVGCNVAKQTHAVHSNQILRSNSS